MIDKCEVCSNKHVVNCHDCENKDMFKLLSVDDVGKQIGRYENYVDILEGKIDRIREYLKQEEVSSIDWSKIEVDTKVLVSHNGIDWQRRYFSNYTKEGVWTFDNGRTSWTNVSESIWKYAKLAEEE